MNIRTVRKRIAHHLADPHSRHRQITIGFIWVSVFVLIGKLAGAAKEMAIAWRYGVSETVDAYVFVFTILTWPTTVWFSVLTLVLIPLFTRSENESSTSLMQFRRELLGFTVLLGSGIGILLYFGFPAVLRAGWSGLSQNALIQALEWVGPLSLIVPLGFVISFFSVSMLARGRHRNTLFEAVPAFVLLIALMLPFSLMADPLLWGTILGFALHLVVLAMPLYRYGHFHIPLISYHSELWKAFWSGLSIMALAQVLMSSTGIIDQFFAANIGPGALSTLSYANRFLALILGLGAIAIGRAILPVFSAARSEGDADLRTLTLRWASWMFVAGIGVVIIGWLLAPFLIKILFERGEFSETDTESVTQIVRIFLLQVPFYFSGIVLMQKLAAERLYKEIVLAAAVACAVKILGNFLFVTTFAVSGIAWATAAFLFSWWLVQGAVIIMKRGQA